MRLKLLVLSLIVALANNASSEDGAEHDGETGQRVISLEDEIQQSTDQTGQQKVIIPGYNTSTHTYPILSGDSRSQGDKYDSNTNGSKFKIGNISSVDSKNDSHFEKNIQKPGGKQSGDLIGAQNVRNETNVKKRESQESGDLHEQLEESGDIQSDSAQKENNKQIIEIKKNNGNLSKEAENTRITEGQKKETRKNETEKQLKENQSEKQNDLNKTNKVEQKENQQLVITENKDSENISKVENISTEERQKELNDNGKESVEPENQQSTDSDEIGVKRGLFKKKCLEKRKSSNSSSSSEEEPPKIKMEVHDDNISEEKTKNENITFHPEHIDVDVRKDKDFNVNQTIRTEINTVPRPEQEPKSEANQKVEPEISEETQSNVTENEAGTGISTIVTPPTSSTLNHHVEGIGNRSQEVHTTVKEEELQEKGAELESRGNITITPIPDVSSGESEELKPHFENGVNVAVIQGNEEKGDEDSMQADEGSILNGSKEPEKNVSIIEEPKITETIIPPLYGSEIPNVEEQVLCHYPSLDEFEITEDNLKEKESGHGITENGKHEEKDTHIEKPKEEKKEEENSYKDDPSKLLKDYCKFNYPMTYVPIMLRPINVDINIFLNTKDLMSSLKENPKSEATKISTQLQENTAENVNEILESHFLEDTDLFDDQKTFYNGHPEKTESQPSPDLQRYDLPYVLMGNMFDKEGNLRPNTIKILNSMGYDSLVDQFYGDDVLEIGSEQKTTSIGGSKVQYDLVDHSQGHEIIDYTGLQQIIPDITSNIVYTLNSMIEKYFIQLSTRQQSSSDTNNVHHIVLGGENIVEEASLLPEEFPNNPTTEEQTKPNISILTPSVTSSNEIRSDKTSSDYKELSANDFPEPLTNTDYPTGIYQPPEIVTLNHFDRTKNSDQYQRSLDSHLYNQPLPYIHHQMGIYPPPEIVALYPSDRTMNSDQYQRSLDSHLYNQEPLPYPYQQMGIYPPLEIVTLNPSDRTMNSDQYQGSLQSANDVGNALIVKPNSRGTINDGYYDVDAHQDDEPSNRVENSHEVSSLSYDTPSDYDGNFEENEYGPRHVPDTVFISNVLDPRERPNSGRIYIDGYHGIIGEKLANLDDERSNRVEHSHEVSSLSYDTSFESVETSEENEYGPRHVPDTVFISNVLDPRERPNSGRIYIDGYHGIIGEKLANLDDERSNRVENSHGESSHSYDTSSDSDETSEKNKYDQEVVPHTVGPISSVPRVQPNSEGTFNDRYSVIGENPQLGDEHPNSVHYLQSESELPHFTRSGYDEISFEGPYLHSTH